MPSTTDQPTRPHRVRRALPRVTAVLGVTAIGLAVGVLPASAHVTVNPGTATAGAFTSLTFRVPNETASAENTSVTVNFPTDHPFASLSVLKQPGWTAQVTKTTLATPVQGDDNLTITEAVSSITWTADDSGQTGPGEFAQFTVSGGPVPDVGSLTFPATQTYSDGTVVDWNEPTPASGEEPEHPAPLLTITEADAAGDPSASAADPSASAADPSASTSTSTSTSTASVEASPLPSKSDNTARVLGVAGIVVGALGLLAGAFSRRRKAASK